MSKATNKRTSLEIPFKWSIKLQVDLFIVLFAVHYVQKTKEEQSVLTSIKNVFKHLGLLNRSNVTCWRKWAGKARGLWNGLLAFAKGFFPRPTTASSSLDDFKLAFENTRDKNYLSFWLFFFYSLTKSNRYISRIIL